MRALGSIALLAMALGSVADRSGTAWLMVRSVWFLSLLGLSRSNPERLVWALAAALGMIAMAGLAGLDLALAALGFVLLPLKLRHLAGLMAGVGVCGAFSFLYAQWHPDWTPVLFPFHNRNHYAVFCELSLPVMVYCWRRGRGQWLLVAAGIMVLTALAGGSRTGAVLLLAESCALWAMVAGREKLWVAGPVVAIAASGFVFLSGGQRILNPFAGDHRFEIWMAGVEMVAARPLAGWGGGEFPRIYPAFALFDTGEFVNAAHSDWLEWMVEYGLLAGLAAAGVFVWWLRKSIHFYPSWGILIGALHAVVDYPFHLPGLLVFAAALAGSIEANGTSIQAQSTDRKRRNSRIPATGGLSDLPR